MLRWFNTKQLEEKEPKKNYYEGGQMRTDMDSEECKILKWK